MRLTGRLYRSVSFYTRPNCGLCMSAHDQVMQARKLVSFDYHEIDITLPQNKEFYDLYAFDVPVVKYRDDCDREGVFMHRLTSSDLIIAVSNDNKMKTGK